VQQRTEMLAGVSHDLKTPLTRMRLQLALMPHDADHDAMAADVAEMEHMVQEYLDFASGLGGEEAAPADIAHLVQEAVQDAVRNEGAEGRIAVTHSEPVALTVRRNALKRCLGNLIGNGLKYGRHIEVALRRTARAVEISVDDDGPGIADAQREEAFRPFHRLDASRNLQTGGVGLGLAIARDIARAHGGDVLLERSPLGGLRALIRLPA
jgi:two-component system osmolarity sensor histidine kinase EnvZ